jgi:CRP/FNR family transcriptional regulator, cyclic AMP receptor protein
MATSLLQNVYLFKSFTQRELETLREISKTQLYSPGETVFIKGEKATALYLIQQGTVKIQRSSKSGDSLDVSALSAGSHFGEMAFIDKEVRSATATAGEKTELVIIPYERLQAYLAKEKDVALKFYHELAHFLCIRLRATTNDLSFEKEKNVRHF